MIDKKYPGLTVSIPLFFNQDESIDYRTLSRYLKELGKQKHISAVYSMAFNTRYRMLSDEELLNLNKEIIKLSKDNDLDCYVGHPYIFNRVRLEKYLREIAISKPAGISMLYPELYYNIDKPILEFLEMPAKFGMNTVIHEMKIVSGFTGELINWPENLLRKAIRLQSVIGVKEDSKDDCITRFALEECKKQDVTCIMAGGGKVRALKFISDGLETWLNGTTMFYPNAIDVIYPAVMNNDTDIINYYNEKIENPFFNDVVNRVGWHLAHKAALEFFGYGLRYERFPHAILPHKDFEQLSSTLNKIKVAFKQLKYG
jgi:dihydrodipicolinate synthase/N-acetylneuraminate lyase